MGKRDGMGWRPGREGRDSLSRQLLEMQEVVNMAVED